MPLDLARKEAMEDEGEMSPHHLKLLVHNFLPAIPDFVFEHAIEFSPEDCSAVPSEPIDIRQRLYVGLIKNAQNPVVCCIDAIQVPLGTTDGGITCADHC